MKKSLTLIFILCLTLGLLFAQEGRGRRHNPVNEQPYYQYMIFRMTEELELSQEQAEKLFPVNRPYRNAKHELHTLLNQLSEEVYSKEEITEADLKAYKKRILDIKEQEIKLDEKYYADVEKFLDPGQVAKLIFFEPRFRRELSTELRQRYAPENKKRKENNTFFRNKK